MHQLAYILAASHSGSTLLSMLLGAHPQICTVGELKANRIGDGENYRCSCGRQIVQCDFWKEIEFRMHQKGLPFSVGAAGTNISATDNAYLRRLIRPQLQAASLELVRDLALGISPAWHRHHALIQKRNAALIGTILELRGARIIVDSSKGGLRLKYLLRNRSLDVKVIRLIRDGRAVSLTYMDTDAYADASEPELRSGGFGKTGAKKKVPMSRAAYEWRRAIEEGERAIRRLKASQWIEIRYETLCVKPVETLREICTFLGVSREGVERDFRKVTQHVVGNGMRLDTSSEIRLDERWKAWLSAEELDIFDSIAGRVNRKYGYS
jgi:hypothetical protein